MPNIPFADTSSIWRDDLNTRTRLRVAQEFLGESWGYDAPPQYDKILDVGDPNFIGEQLGATDNTLQSDFNFSVGAKNPPYQIILCFEVLEHVMNPLNFLRQLSGLLHNNGRIYLSTPVVSRVLWYQWVHHFTEYKLPQLGTLVEYAGFEIVRKKIFCPYPWYFMFYGVRPFFRVLLHRNVIMELKKK